MILTNSPARKKGPCRTVRSIALGEALIDHFTILEHDPNFAPGPTLARAPFGKVYGFAGLCFGFAVADSTWAGASAICMARRTAWLRLKAALSV